MLKQRVRDSMDAADVTDWDSFVARCNQNSVEVRRSTARDGRGISYRMLRQDGTDGGGYLPGSPGDVRRAAKFGTEFMMDAVEEALQRNIQANHNQLQATAAQPTIPHTTPAPDKSEKTTPSASAAGMVGTADLSEESTSYAAATDVPAPASTPLPQDAKKADPFADLHAEMAAHLNASADETRQRLGLGKTLEQLDAEKAAEAAQTTSEPIRVTEARKQVSEPVEREESTSSASATDVPTAAASAPLPPPADKPYRSRLWEFESDTPSARERAHRLAAYEEIAVPLLEAGKRLDDRVLTSIGVRESVMKKLGPFMHSDFRKQLELRAKKLARAKQLHEMGMPQAAKELRAQASAGVYETVAVESARKKVRLSAPQERQIEDDGMSL